MMPHRSASRLFSCTVFLLPLAAASCAPWTGRVCASNASGNCRPIDNGDPHQHLITSSGVGPVQGLSDVMVRDPSCVNGIGEVDVEVIDRTNLQLTIFCLNDTPVPGKFTPTPARSSPVQPPVQPPLQPSAPGPAAPPAGSH